MFKMTLRQNSDFLNRVRSWPNRAQVLLRRKLVTVLGPELEAWVNEAYIANAPPTPPDFLFASENSRLFYVIAVHQFPELTDGAHWLRGGPMALETAWRVEVTDRLSDTQMKVVNIQREDKMQAIGARDGTGTESLYPAEIVMGPYGPPGHMLWAKLTDQIRAQLQEKFTVRVRELWVEALREAWQA